MNTIEVTLPRAQWESIRDAADKASPFSLYKDYPGLHQSYVEIFRVADDALRVGLESETLTAELPLTTLSTIFQMPEFEGLRDGMPAREQWFEAQS